MTGGCVYTVIIYMTPPHNEMKFYLVYGMESIFSTTYQKEEVKIKSK